MKKKQYFKLETNLMKNDSTQRLIQDLGMEGIGFFMTLIFHLRKQKQFRCNVGELRILAANTGMNPEVAEKVVYKYGLFKFENINGQVYFSSHHLNESMKEDLCRAEASKQRLTRIKRRGDGKFVKENQVPNIKEEEEEKTQQEAASQMLWRKKLGEAWSKYIDEAIEDRGWLEAIAMNNSLPVLSQLDKITEIFKRHVIVQGRESHIFSANEAKNYFANYARRGTPTYKTLMSELKEKQKVAKQTNPYRFENINPKTGERTYCGIIIPPSAPPRPSENAVWNPLTQQWEL